MQSLSFSGLPVDLLDFNFLFSQLENRPAWDEAHHVGMGSNAEYFKLKSSGLSEVTQMSVVERLNRYFSFLNTQLCSSH